MASQSHYRGSINENTVIAEQGTGSRRAYTIKPKALDIVWGADSRYWRLPTNDEGPAELLQVSWVEVSGSLDLSKLDEGSYKLAFMVSLQSDAFGWQNSPVYLMVKVGQGKQKWKKFDLSSSKESGKFEIPQDLKFEVTKKDREGPEKLRFGLYEIWRGRWKGGLLIHEVNISPA